MLCTGIVILLVLGFQDCRCGRVLISRPKSQRTSPSKISETFALPPKDMTADFAFDKIILENQDPKSSRKGSLPSQITIQSNPSTHSYDFSFRNPKSLIKPERLVKPQYYLEQPRQSQHYQWTQGLNALATIHSQEEYEDHEDSSSDYPRLNELQIKPLAKSNPPAKVNFTIQPSNPQVKPHLRVLSLSVNKGQQRRQSSKPIKRIVRRMKAPSPSASGPSSSWVKASSPAEKPVVNPKPKRNVGPRNVNNSYSHPSRRDVIPIVKQVGNMEQSGDRRFFFEYEGGNGVKRNEEGYLKDPNSPNPIQVIQGSYSYPGPNGKIYSVIYVADENGFRASGEHLPV
ncbi:hypothetical protein TCAL_05798 [Tigriopus californicus]|uniref:Uncharacterized protein n=1 Tax=Tigriopus californicus TaxID=6832 RepID=A0A553PNY7_TIGCA|nr:uncharacterized protein LOC131881958 [Tigriopus californicus]TRY79397.1 hypothetical protein TCAL_05798 [Tigriopus californicus]